MGKSISFVVPGDPVPKKRARVTKNGTFTPAETKRFESDVAAYASIAWRTRHLDSWPRPVKENRGVRFSLAINIYFRDDACADGDNVEKSIADGMNRVAYWSDKQVKRCVWEEFIDPMNPRTEVTLTILECL
jgi:Holliday junction resolvase RusA-like endonuclease